MLALRAAASVIRGPIRLRVLARVRRSTLPVPVLDAQAGPRSGDRPAGGEPVRSAHRAAPHRVPLFRVAPRPGLGSVRRSPRRPDARSRRDADPPPPIRLRSSGSVRGDEHEEGIRARDGRNVPRDGGRATAGSILNTCPRYATASEETNGPPPCAPQGQERFDPPVSEGESRMGRDGKGRGGGDDPAPAPGGLVLRGDRRATARCVRRPERPPRDGAQPPGDLTVEGREVRAASGSREPDQARRELADPPQRARQRPQQQARTATHRVEDPTAVPLLQGSRGYAVGLGLLPQVGGTVSEVGDRWRSAWTTWRPKVFSIARGRRSTSSMRPRASARSATTTRTARPLRRSSRGP